MPLHYPGRNTDSQTPIAQPCGRTPKEQDRSSETASIQLLAPKFLAAHLIPPTEWHVFRGNYMPLMQIAVGKIACIEMRSDFSASGRTGRTGSRWWFVARDRLENRPLYGSLPMPISRISWRSISSRIGQWPVPLRRPLPGRRWRCLSPSSRRRSLMPRPTPAQSSRKTIACCRCPSTLSDKPKGYAGRHAETSDL